MPEALIHPTAQELTAFSLGKLPERRAAAVAAHLESCPACRKAVANVPPDSFLGKVRAAKPGVSSLPAQASDAPRIANASTPSAPPKDLPPDLANYSKYCFLRELGRGGMGVVYQAEQTVMGRTVAVKVINPSVLDHPDALPRFQGEVKAAAKLDHPNIVRAHDAEQVGSMHLLVMEYVEGASLADMVAKKGPLSVAHACHYIRQAALGLQHAFEQGMVHRDIKPHNLMVNARGQVKVLDFGLARMRSERKAGGGLTQVDAFMGTPEYVSPEQATDARSADTRADIYSLGCTLFFLLAGRPPFQGDTVVKLIMAQIEKEPPALQEVRSDVPSELSAVVARMLAKDPAHRFQTPLEVAQALTAFVKPGTKRQAAGVSSSAAGVSSPGTGTAMAVDTSKIKMVLREVPGKAGPKKVPATDAASAFADLTDAGAGSQEVGRARKAAKPSRAAWWKRPGVQAAAVGISLALVLMAVIIIKIKVQTPNGDTAKATSSGGSAGTPKSPPAEAIVVLEIDQPGAEVSVVGENITVKAPRDNEPIQIKVEPGQHKLRIRKAGFEAVTKDIELKTGESLPIKIRLEPVPPKPADDGFVQLFNGKNLNGWKVFDGGTGNWKVVDGIIVGSGPMSHLFSERGNYENFHYRVEVMINDGGNSGQYFRTEFGPGFPKGYEAQINSTHGDHIRTGSLYPSFGTLSNEERDNIIVRDQLVKPNEWFIQEVIADGNHIIIKVKHKTTVDFVDHKNTYKKGHFALQQHNPGTVVKFRKIEVKELATKPEDVESRDKAHLPPSEEEWIRKVRTLPAKEQVEKVAAKLQERNPGFDGVVTYTIKNGVVVTGLKFVTDHVTDISPVRALPALKFLSCHGSGPGKGKLVDLSPLKGMPLTTLDCNFTRVSDLSPLKDMKLSSLLFEWTQVSDLSPLKGMNLTGDLDCGGTRVSDLSPLKGMKLTRLTCSSTGVSDISPLKGMPLKVLYCNFLPERDTEILRSIKTLEWINGKPAARFWNELDGTKKDEEKWIREVRALPAKEQVEKVAAKLKERNPGFDGAVTYTIKNGVVVTGLEFVTDHVTDVSPLRALPRLTRLKCQGSGLNNGGENNGVLADLSPLKDMHLTQFGCCGNNRISDLLPLKGMQLTVLSCIGTSVSDLSPLKGMPLAELYCGFTQVSDLSPLKGMHLTAFGCAKTQVSDLIPLKGIRLTWLACFGTAISDLSPLKGMPLKTLNFDFQAERDTESLRSIKTLETINGKPVAQFWKEVDEKNP